MTQGSRNPLPLLFNLFTLTFKYVHISVVGEVFSTYRLQYIMHRLGIHTHTHTHAARLFTDASEPTHPSPHVRSFSAHSFSHSTPSVPLLPLWLCCRVSSMLAESLAPSSASLRLVALSSDRRLVTSWLAD